MRVIKVHRAVVIANVERIDGRGPVEVGGGAENSEQSRRRFCVEGLLEVDHRAEKLVGHGGRDDPNVVCGSGVYVNIVQHTSAWSVHRTHDRARRVVRDSRLALAAVFVGVATKDVIVVVQCVVNTLGELKDVVVDEVLRGVVVAVGSGGFVRQGQNMVNESHPRRRRFDPARFR